MNIILVVLGLIAGGIMGFLLARNKSSASETGFRDQISLGEKEKAALHERVTQQQLQLENAHHQLEEERKITLEQTRQLAQLKTVNENLLEKLQTEKSQLEALQKKFQTEFENIASKILEDKGNKFTEQNKANMDSILTPLKERIMDFEKKVDVTYKTEAAERNSLKGEIKSLVELNKDRKSTRLNSSHSSVSRMPSSA